MLLARLSQKPFVGLPAAELDREERSEKRARYFQLHKGQVRGAGEVLERDRHQGLPEQLQAAGVEGGGDPADVVQPGQGRLHLHLLPAYLPEPLRPLQICGLRLQRLLRGNRESDIRGDLCAHVTNSSFIYIYTAILVSGRMGIHGSCIKRQASLPEERPTRKVTASKSPNR